MSHSKDIVFMVFDYAKQNGYLKILIRWPWEKHEWGRGPRFHPIFWSLKKSTRTFHLNWNEHSCEILGPLGPYDDPWGKKQKNKQINTQPWSVFWHKIRNSTFLWIGAWKFGEMVLWYAECDGGIFVKILWLLGGISSYFLKERKCSRNFW